LVLRAFAQGTQQPEWPIGAVSTQGNLIVLTLDDHALGGSKMFDLVKRTLRFTLRWEAGFGEEFAGPAVPLRHFTFPFSGRNWDALSVGVTGSIGFGSVSVDRLQAVLHRDGTIEMSYDEMRRKAPS
jgi:hypothetical protein